MKFSWLLIARTGQEAVNVAREFNQQLEVTGVILTKIDGDTAVVLRLPSVKSLENHLNSLVLAKDY